MATKLLVVIDPERDDQPALGRALEIAEHIDVSLHVTVFGNPTVGDRITEALDPALVPDGERDLNALRQIWLDQVVGPVKEQGLHVTSQVQPFTKLYESIIQVALEEDVDMVLKPTRHHSILRRVLFNSTDWNLVRLCPFPLLLINDAHPVRGRDVLAAVDLVSEDDDHSELNQLLLSQAVMIAKLIGSEVKIVTAVPRARSAGREGSDQDAEPAANSAIRGYRDKAAPLAEHFNIPAERILIREGSAERVVNHAADEMHAAAIILGTVARGGLAGLFIGNTAEKVLEDSITDVLVVKQADFRTPIQVEGDHDEVQTGSRGRIPL